jgi:hypothetical protein
MPLFARFVYDFAVSWSKYHNLRVAELRDVDDRVGRTAVIVGYESAGCCRCSKPLVGFRCRLLGLLVRCLEVGDRVWVLVTAVLVLFCFKSPEMDDET